MSKPVYVVMRSWVEVDIEPIKVFSSENLAENYVDTLYSQHHNNTYIIDFLCKRLESLEEMLVIIDKISAISKENSKLIVDEFNAQTIKHVKAYLKLHEREENDFIKLIIDAYLDQKEYIDVSYYIEKLELD
jgi:hypothetical protein